MFAFNIVHVTKYKDPLAYRVLFGCRCRCVIIVNGNSGTMIGIRSGPHCLHFPGRV